MEGHTLRALASRPWTGALRALFAAALLMLAGGCSVRLAPDYDPSIVSGLQDLNQQGMTFFASVASGTSAADYANRSATYNALVGSANALQVQADSRPDMTQSEGWFGKKVMELEKITRIEAPTSTILGNISQQFTLMQSTDQRQGLTSVEVQAFQGQFRTYMSQALTYEQALQR